MIAAGVLGIEIGATRLRALRLGRRGRPSAEALEVDWSAAAPADAVAAVRERFGSGARLAVAIDPEVLLVKRLSLPALPALERRRMIALDPDRYFPVRDESLVVGVGTDDLVVAARTEQFDRMMDALAAVGVVERVEPAPAALVRYLAASGVTSAFIVMTHPGDRDCALVLMREGQVASVRKLPNDAAEIAAAAPVGSDPEAPCFLYPWLDPLADGLARCGVSVKPVPASGGSAESFAAARGALLGIDAPDGLTLASPALERRQRAQAGRRGLFAVAALLVAIGAALWSVSARRARTLAELQRRIGAQQERVVDLQRIQADIGAARQELGKLAMVSRQRPDPLAGLLLITQLLPPDAQLGTLHAAGEAWELDGYARDAASLIPTFAANAAVADVHFRAATTRVQVGNRTYENFSLALRYPRPSH